MLKIRKHLREDSHYRLKWLNDEDVTRFLGDDPLKKTTLSDQNKWFDAYLSRKNMEFFTICDDERPIGFMGLSNISKTNNNADLFIAIGEKDYRGKGYGRKSVEWLLNHAFIRLKLNKVNLKVFAENENAILLYKKLGFQTEGFMKEEIFFCGRYHDEYSMALFAKEYLKK